MFVPKKEALQGPAQQRLRRKALQHRSASVGMCNILSSTSNQSNTTFGLILQYPSFDRDI
jgi:hypothetical protein